MGWHDRRCLMMLVMVLVIAGGILCLLHAHDDGLDVCAQALAFAGVALLAAAQPGQRLVPVLALALPFRVPELTSPPPRG